MIKLFAKISISIIFIQFLAISSTFSQMECRSMLGAYLKPIGKTPISWALEETIAHGWMSDRNITNNLFYTGLDFTKKSHTIYFEGGYKGWRNSLGATGKGSGAGNGFDLGSFGLFQQNRLGIREAYYRYTKSNIDIIAGLHTTKLNDYFLVDERALGIDYKQNFGALYVNANVSTVLFDFVRMGNFCTVKYLYNTIKGKYDPYIGDSFGETNFASFVISYKPSEKGSWKNNKNDDFDEFKNIDETDKFKDLNNEDEFTEFSDDEFNDVSNNSEFNSLDSNSVNKDKFDFSKIVNEYGLIVYEEFGDSVPNLKNYFGLMSSFNLPFKTELKIEVLNQMIASENTIGYYINLQRVFNWKPGSTNINCTYGGKYEITKGTNFYAAYSNFYMSEVMRMDLWDMPIISAQVKHTFKNKLKPYIKIKAVQQLISPRTNSIDLETGFKFLKHCKLTGIFSRISSNALPEKVNYLARFELRIAF